MALDADTIESLATKPAQASADGMSATARSATDVITLANYAAQKRASANRGRGIRITKLIMGGQTDSTEGRN